MKKIIATCALLIGGTLLSQVGVGNNSPEGILDTSNDKGYPFVLPQTLQKDIVNPIDGTNTNIKEGSLYFDTNLDCLRVFDGTEWKDINCINRSLCLSSAGEPPIDIQNPIINDKASQHINTYNFDYPKSDTQYDKVHPLTTVQVKYSQASPGDYPAGKVLYEMDNGKGQIVVLDPYYELSYSINSFAHDGLEGVYILPDDSVGENSPSYITEKIFKVQLGLIGQINKSSTITKIYPPVLDVDACTMMAQTIIRGALDQSNTPSTHLTGLKN
ncbi:hypothetical protein UJ101_01171 [Flavobacteriaceae bacterium UJ101]|nr:hypothetical protein UJ101_01171 [Flavobacteriaceae bacterium UJ101]